MAGNTWKPEPPPTRPGGADVLAGLSVALVLIPQSMAYAELAGLPPHIGLFAAALPPILASLAASSPYLQTGPVALTSLLTLGGLAELAQPGSVDYVELAALLALIVGLTRLTLGLFRLGVVAYLMSEPVLSGFTSGAAILILSSQLPKALGVDAPDGGVLERAWWSLTNPDDWGIGAVAIAAVTVLLVLGGRRLHRLFPGALVAVVGGVAFSRITGYEGPVVGSVPTGFPDIGLDLPWGSTGSLVVAGVVIALVGFAEPASISRMFATADRQPWSADREFISQGLANIAAGLSGAFPVGGSFSRSSLNRLAGARSRWSGLVTGVAVLAFLPFADVLEPLPRATLGGVVIAAVVGLVQPVQLVDTIRRSTPQGLVAWGTFGATLAMAPRVERGVIIGIGLSLALHLWRELHVDVPRRREGNTLCLDTRGVLWFATASRLEQLVLDALAEEPDIDCLRIDLGGCGRVDYTAATTIRRLAEDARAAGLAVSVTGVPADVAGYLSEFS
ncbi:MAG: SulP family inorganic anion transporter [Acidimicrobiales bacterium]|jgi:SulP family sulfate permease|nr:SulP family inorganic anion transporter [Acidimicrobiales bacterium]|tara:strand:- start:13277 stop:14791 length:1515 start_codon:yes stop_codon:yes gene_type:complete